MTTESSKTSNGESPTPEEEFPLGPYLDTVYRWAEIQPGFETEFDAAWRTFAGAGPSETAPVPDVEDPDQHDRLLRFWAYFALDRPLTDSRERPIDRFLASLGRDLTAEGQTVYAGLARSVFGAFRVQVKFRMATLELLGHTGGGHGERYTLAVSALGEELQPGDLVVGRLYPFENLYIADPDVHIGHLSEAPSSYPLDAAAAEKTYFTALVPAKGPVMDVVDALLMQIDSPLTADDVFEMIREADSLDAVLEALYGAPAYKLRFLHLRDRSLLDELLQELWDTAGPLQDASLSPEDATALARTVREGLRAIAEGDAAALKELADPKGFLTIYLDLFGMQGLQRLAGVTDGPPSTAIRTKHQLLPKDGGIFTTLTWGKDGQSHSAGMVAYGTPEGRWRLADLSPPEGASPIMMMAYDRAQHLGWASPEPADAVEGYLRAAVMEVGYAVHDTIDLFRLWRDFKAAASPDLSQPAIWAAGVELADSRYRNENLDVKVLAKSYGVMPKAIVDAADRVDTTLKALEAES